MFLVCLFFLSLVLLKEHHVTLLVSKWFFISDYSVSDYFSMPLVLHFDLSAP